ncbi:MAG: transglutaminase-like domain-containing protein [Smithellaceae bacterium]
MTKNTMRLLIKIAIILIFIGLLAVRLGLFKEKTQPAFPGQAAEFTRSPETWMNIYQKNQKIGVVSKKFFIHDSGISIQEDVSLQLNTLGVIQVMHISAQADLNPDMTLRSFDFDITSSLFRYSARGLMGKDRIILHTGLPSAMQKSEIRIKDLPYLSGNIYEASFLAGLEKDETRSFGIFDPSTLSVRDIDVTRQPDEIIPIMGKKILTQKFCADFMGAAHCAWVAKDGEVIKETGLLGMSMEKVSAAKAKEGLSDTGADFATIASIESNITIPDPKTLTGIVLRIDGISTPLPQIHGGRQKLHQNILTITKEPSFKIDHDIPEALRRYLAPSPLVQADHPEIIARSKKIVSPTDPPDQKIRKIVYWVYKNVDKKPVLSVPNALEVLRNKVGDCNEHAVLTAALLRAAGIPAQIETGLTYLNGRFYYHAWNTAYAGNWLTVDSVFNQIPADVTHIRLSLGEGSQQLDLLGVMGKIQLEVLSLQ